MLILGIESSCDETACAVVRDGKEILSNLLSSQAALHSRFGGVFPEIASRQHLEAIHPIVNQALSQAGIQKRDLDLIAVAQGPGLVGSLLTGITWAKALAYGLNIPFVGVNHVEAHLYAAMMPLEAPLLPALGLVVSGGHTFLCYIEEIGRYFKIGTTVDDAIGEAFDKVARLLNLPYPGGPELERLAKGGDPIRYGLRAGLVKENPWNFSFSGIKTSMLQKVRGVGSQPPIPPAEYPHLAASFQRAVFSSVVQKCARAAREFPCKALYLGGGVSQNQELRRLLHEEFSPHLPLFFPGPELCCDNAAMIAGLAYHLVERRGGGDRFDLAPFTKLSWGESAGFASTLPIQ